MFLYTFQCDLEVTDNGYPQAQTSSQRVIVNIRRGEMPSWFPDRRYSATLNENDPNGTFVVNVEARKANPLVSVLGGKSVFLLNFV